MQARMAQTVLEYARTGPESLWAALAAQHARDPRCPVTNFLLACQYLDRSRPAHAVRHMMMAYRFEPKLESAALLVFAGLEWIGQRGTDLLPVLLTTWEAFRRPQFDRTPVERRLLDAFAEDDDGLAAAPPLARRVWRLPIRTLRSQIRAAIVSRDAALFALLSAST